MSHWSNTDVSTSTLLRGLLQRRNNRPRDASCWRIRGNRCDAMQDMRSGSLGTHKNLIPSPFHGM